MSLKCPCKNTPLPEIIACMAEKSALILGAAQGICDNLVQNHGIAAEHCLTIDAFY